MAENTLSKNRAGYGYKYTDLAETNKFLADQGIAYYQYVETLDGEDYIWTVPIVDGKELPPRRGCRIVDAELSGKANAAQEQGSAITYARRYSLWMAFGLGEYSVSATSVLSTRKHISLWTKQEACELAEKVMQLKTATEVYAVLQEAAR